MYVWIYWHKYSTVQQRSQWFIFILFFYVGSLWIKLTILLALIKVSLVVYFFLLIMKKVDIMCSNQTSIEHQQQTTPARKQVTLHLLTMFVSHSCSETFTFLPHAILPFSSLPLTFQPASHLHTVSQKTCLSAATEALMHPEPCD